jgi:hypothetical protein
MRKLKKEIKEFIKKVSPETFVNFHKGNMESDVMTREIFVNIDEFLYEFEDEKSHLQIMKENGLITDILLPTYILLHEIGHVVSFKKYVAKRALLRQYNTQVVNIYNTLKGLKRMREYKKLKLERDADNFAYNYYLHNYNFVKEFDNKIRELIFYL